MERLKIFNSDNFQGKTSRFCRYDDDDKSDHYDDDYCFNIVNFQARIFRFCVKDDLDNTCHIMMMKITIIITLPIHTCHIMVMKMAIIITLPFPLFCSYAIPLHGMTPSIEFQSL